jgi:hypothetical protein
VPLGTPTPPSAALEQPLSRWAGTRFDWARLEWRQISLSARLERDSLYNGYNGGLAFYRGTFSARAAGAPIRLRLNARHRAVVYCNGRFVGEMTVYAAETLKAGAPFGPDLTHLGTRLCCAVLRCAALCCAVLCAGEREGGVGVRALREAVRGWCRYHVPLHGGCASVRSRVGDVRAR